MDGEGILFRPPCLGLKNSDFYPLIALPVSDYFEYRQRCLWNLKIDFSGQSLTFNPGNDEIDLPPFITRKTFSAEVVRVRNDGRENYFPVVECGRWKDAKDPSFNPPKEYGKIPDEDLIRLGHNPCHDCSFTAFCNLTVTWQNLFFGSIRPPRPGVDEDFNPLPPPRPSCDWETWSPGLGPFVGGEDFNENPSVSWLVSGRQRVPATFSMALADNDQVDSEYSTVFSRPSIGGDYAYQMNGASEVNVMGQRFPAQLGEKFGQGVTAIFRWVPGPARDL